MKPVVVEAPAYWAPALINEDFEGYEPLEIEEIRAWASLYGWPVSVEPPYVGRHHGKLTELAEYTVLMPE